MVELVVLPVAAAADGLDEVDKVVGGEGQLQRTHLVQHTAQGPHVRLTGRQMGKLILMLGYIH